MIRGIYIHIPFCRRKCFYCDFPIAVIGNQKANAISKSDEYTSYLLREFQNTKQRMIQYKKETSIETIYFGGGTPSLLEDSCKTLLTQPMLISLTLIRV